MKLGYFRSWPFFVILSTVSFTLFNTYSCSKENSICPKDCEHTGFSFNKDLLLLNAHGTDSKRTIFLINNVSDGNLILNHPVADPGASAGWVSNLESHNWSAITLKVPNFSMSCSAGNQESFKQIPCDKVLKVCQILDPEFGSDFDGNFWVSENKSLNVLLEDVKKRGVEF